MKVRLGDIEVGYTERGDGPPLVMVHGLAEDRRSWGLAQERLAGDYRTLACDLRGHGETEAGDGDGTLDQLAGDLARFLEALTGPAACIGYSLGGTIVLALAAARPDLVMHAVVERYVVRGRARRRRILRRAHRAPSLRTAPRSRRRSGRTPQPRSSPPARTSTRSPRAGSRRSGTAADTSTRRARCRASTGRR